MTRQIRHVAIAMIVLFVALLINSNVVQVGEASSLADNPHNVRVLYNSYDIQRGAIIADGKDVAQSVATNGALKYLRTYPGGAAYAPVTGFDSLVVGDSGIEQAENSVLSGSDNRLLLSRISDEITGRTPQGGSVTLTLNAKAQQAAYAGLHGRPGAVVALDPSTGAILAMVSSPSYDPSLLTGHDTATAQRNYQQLLHASGDPLVDRALSETYPPGSMFKIITASAAFSAGLLTPSSTVDSPTQLKLPDTDTYLHNFGGESCGNGQTDTVADAFRISCNTAFANIGLKVGVAGIAAQAAKFGFGSSFSVPMTSAASQYNGSANLPNTALSAIGQYDDAITPLQAAMVGATIANHGVEMAPYLVAKTQAPDTDTISTASPHVLATPVTPQVASEVTGMMKLVVQSGTGTAAQIPGIEVAGKTGTADHGLPSQHLPPEAWFVAFAPADHPQIAVAVLVENGGGLGSDGVGGAVSAPIAKSVMCAVLRCP